MQRRDAAALYIWWTEQDETHALSQRRRVHLLDCITFTVICFIVYDLQS